MIARLYEAITGRAWTTTRTASLEFGPPPGAVYADRLAAYSDAELLNHGPAILAHLEATEPRNDAKARARAGAAAGARAAGYAVPAGGGRR